MLNNFNQINGVPLKNAILLILHFPFDVNINWLKTGTGEMFTSDSNTASRRRVLGLIDSLDDNQLDRVTKFIKCFLEEE